MNKAELVNRVAEQTKSTKVQTEKIIDATITTIRNQVADGSDVKLVGFGTFTKTERKARRGHNPQTGAEIEIPGGWYPKFRPGTEFKKILK
ncbi:MAG: HU family DNA-binding protein [Bdellovibrionales bacterium]